MRTQAIIAAGLLLACAFSSAHAQLQSRPVPNRGVESFTFQSPSMGVRFSINVGLPEGYDAGNGKKYPALLVTDGDFTFGSVYEAASTLRGVTTPLIIISAGTSLEEGEGSIFGVGSTNSHRPAGIERTHSARKWSATART